MLRILLTKGRVGIYRFICVICQIRRNWKISKITDGFAAAGLKAAEFKEDCGGMLVTLYRNTDLVNGLSLVESAEEVPKSAEEGDLGDNLRRNQEETNEKTGEKTKEKTREKIVKLIKENPYITQKEMQESLPLSKSGVEYQIKQFKDKRIIERVGGDYGGYWKVL